MATTSSANAFVQPFDLAMGGSNPAPSNPAPPHGVYANDSADMWTATWPSLDLSWMAADHLSTTIRHEAYLTARRSSTTISPLIVDPYLGKAPNAADSSPIAWQIFYPNLSADNVENFGRATNNDVLVDHVPRDHTAFVLFRLYVLQHANHRGAYQWIPVLQSLVPRRLIQASLLRASSSWPPLTLWQQSSLKVTVTKVKKRKGTPTQSTALLMLEAVDLVESYRQLAVHYSSMFGIMRRSYLAKVKAKEAGLGDEDMDAPPEYALRPGSSARATETVQSFPAPQAAFILPDTAEQTSYVDLGNFATVTQDMVDTGDTYRRALTVAETSLEFYAIRIATYLGLTHREKGFNEAPGLIEAPLQYYAHARERMVMATHVPDGWTDLVRLLAARASARLELDIRRLLRTPSRRLYATLNFHGGYDGPGTIVVNGQGNVVELNKDPITGRALELHDNVAILARWVHMQGILSREAPGYDSQTIYDEVHRNTLIPYFENLTGHPATHDQVLRFWTFLDLEYSEYWFYFLQVAEAVPLYRMTVALQRLEAILQQLSPQSDSQPSMNTPIRPDPSFWFKDLPQ